MLRLLAWIGRSLLALILSRICVGIGLLCWTRFTLWLAYATSPSQVLLDTEGLSVPLAAYSVSAGIGLLSLPPLLLACWGHRHSLLRRIVAALAGLGAGLAFVMLWQGYLTWWTGYSFARRYAFPDPVTDLDYLMLALAALVESWFTLRFVPLATRARQGHTEHPSA